MFKFVNILCFICVVFLVLDIMIFICKDAMKTYNKIYAKNHDHSKSKKRKKVCSKELQTTGNYYIDRMAK